MKKFLFTFIFMFISIFTISAYSGTPKVNVNGKNIENIAIIKANRTLVGVRGVFEELGYDVQWNNNTSTATLQNYEYTVILKNGDNSFTVNDKIIKPDVPHQIINSKFYLPLRAIGEAIGADVSWDKESETAIIKTTDSEILTEVSEPETEISTKEAETVTEQTEPTIDKATPGVHTIKNLLMTGLMPVGKTMYIYGGGWNEEDTGAGIEARTIGLSPKWAEFASKQTSSYNYSDYNYKKNVSVIHLGLDCSGYIGWTIYNTLNTQNNLDGLVDSSKKMAGNFANLGWGALTKKGNFTDYKAGDIMSASCNDCAHVWMCVGQCDDGSVVFLHSSPQGVMLSGTYTRSGNKSSQAVALASKYMEKYFPDWHSKYPDSSRNASYLSHYDRFRWTLGIKLEDPEGLTNMAVEDVLKEIFNENINN